MMHKTCPLIISQISLEFVVESSSLTSFFWAVDYVSCIPQIVILSYTGETMFEL